MADARQITRALQGRWHGTYGMVKCPAHKDRTPSCQLSDNGQELVVHCHAGCDWRAVKDALVLDGLLEPFKPAAQYSKRPPIKHSRIAVRAGGDRVVEPNEHLPYAWQLWNEATPAIGSTHGEYYLLNRAIGLIDPISAIRFHPALPHPETPGKKWPALLFALTAFNGTFDGIQRIWIDPDTHGKAPVNSPKMTLGSSKGSAIRFGDPSHVEGIFGNLTITGGPEDGLSLVDAGHWPVWVACGESRMVSMQVPSPLQALTIAADGDAVGQRLARSAAGELAGRVLNNQSGVPNITCLFPAAPHKDHNAVAVAKMRCEEAEQLPAIRAV